MKTKETNNSTVEFIVCPQCSSTKFSIDEDGVGTCNYCGATFIVNENESLDEEYLDEEYLDEEEAYFAELNEENAEAKRQCKASLVNAFKKLLPLWITTWFFMAFSIVAFALVVNPNLSDYGTLKAVFAIIGTACTAPCLLASTICTRVTAKRNFIKLYCTKHSMPLESAKDLWKSGKLAVSPGAHSPRTLLYIFYIIGCVAVILFNVLSCALLNAF